MPPALNHKKSRKGCKRCKARKVRCDESKPSCLACARHNVECEYSTTAAAGPAVPQSDDDADHLLELQLLHEWTAHTCETISTAWEFYKYEAPALAFRFRFVMDALLAMSALYISKHGAKRMSSARVWDITQGVKASEGQAGPSLPQSGPPSGAGQAAATTAWFEKRDLVKVSRGYFLRALEGQRQAVAEISLGNIKAAWVCTYLVSCYTMFTLSEGSNEDEHSGLEAVEWVRGARGVVSVAMRWHELAGLDWVAEAGSMYGEPDLVDISKIYLPEHRALFLHILEPVEGDSLTPEDREAYEDTLSYIGLIHKGVVENSESPLSIIRRIVATAARAPPRFSELVLAYQPRAIVVLAHLFAIVGLAGERIPWLEGIAQCQLPKLCAWLSEPWRDMIEWPLKMMTRWETGDGLKRGFSPAGMS